MFKKILIIALVTCAACAFEPGHSKESYVFSKFQEFLTTHNKKYDTIQEYMARFKVFQSNYEKLENFAIEEGSSHSVGITKFFDLTPQEFKSNYLNLKINLLDMIKQNGKKAVINTNDAPESFDWRKEGAVGKVKDQAQCGSCWAFSAIANLEGQYFIKNKKSIILSEQQLVDCDTKGEDQGCNGGLMEFAFEYTKNNGVELSKDYSYTGRDGRCKYDSSKAVVKNTGSQFAPSEDEGEIKEFLFKTGPLSIAINANPLQWYSGGIIDLSSSRCDPQGLNHGVAIVGYGSENGKDYWIVRNSWSASWGEQGYFKIARGKGTCGVNTYVISATLN